MGDVVQLFPDQPRICDDCGRPVYPREDNHAEICPEFRRANERIERAASEWLRSPGEDTRRRVADAIAETVVDRFQPTLEAVVRRILEAQT